MGDSIYFDLDHTGIIAWPSIFEEYLIFVQQGYENLQETTNRIICVNCHLAKKPVGIEVPQSVLPNTVFEVIVKILYDTQIKQVLANGKKGALNVGANLNLSAHVLANKIRNM